MRPLLLHGSSAAKAPNGRRVVHLEFTADELPDGIRWRRLARCQAEVKLSKTAFYYASDGNLSTRHVGRSLVGFRRTDV